jgi:Family of unknown function (DUF6325)
MSDEQLEQLEDELQEMGPIDYVVLAWPVGRPRGEVAPLIVNLVERGIIRILDIAFVSKDADGNLEVLDLEHLGPGGEFAEFEGASSGLMDFEDMKEAAANLEPNSSAAILVWENRWAAPVAIAIRRSGGLLLDSGRIPVQGILAALDALEAAEAQN